MNIKKKFTIIQVLPYLNSGGVEKGTIEIASYLSKNKHNSIVISGGGRLLRDLEKGGSEHILLNIGKKSPSVILCILKLIQIIFVVKPDIIHARSRLPAWIVYLTLKLIPKTKRPFFVTTVHGFNSVSFYSSIMTKGDKVIAVSESIKNFVLKKYKVDEQKIIVIHRGVPDNLNRNFNIQKHKKWIVNFQKNYPSLKNKKILLFPSRISRNKGVEEFVKLINTLRKNQANIIGLMVGEAGSKNYLRELEQHIKDLGLKEDIIFLGFRNDIYNIMKYSNIIFAIQRVPESFGRIVIEGIKLGIPVIGYDHGGVGEQLRTLFPLGLVEYGKFQKVYTLTRKFLNKKPRIIKTNKFTLGEMKRKTFEVYKSFY